MSDSSTCTTSNGCSPNRTIPRGHALRAGMIGGLAGGVVFGTAMQMMGMMPVLASMFGSQSVLVGWAIHLMISVFFGLILGLLLPFIPQCPASSLASAMAFGTTLWALGPLTIMPIMMHTPLFAINETTRSSFMGHIMYAVIALVVARIASKRLPSRVDNDV